MTTQEHSILELKHHIKRFNIKENDETGSIYLFDKISHNTFINETEMARFLKQPICNVSQYINKKFKYVSHFYDEIKTISKIQLTGCRLLHGDFIYYNSSLIFCLVQLQIKNNQQKLNNEDVKKLRLLNAFLHLGSSYINANLIQEKGKYFDIILNYNLNISEEYAYFILDRSNNKIKIGYSCNPLIRLKNLQQASSMPLELIHTMKGGFWIEQSLHARFKKDRIHNEWFNYNNDIAAFLFSRSADPYIL